MATIILIILVGVVAFMAIFQRNVQELIITTPRTESYVKCLSNLGNNTYLVEFVVANSGGSDLKLERLYLATDLGLLEVPVTNSTSTIRIGNVNTTVYLRGFAGVELWRGQLGIISVKLSLTSPLYTNGSIYSLNAYFKTIAASYEMFVVAEGRFKAGEIGKCVPVYKLVRVERNVIYFDTFDTNPFDPIGIKMINMTCYWAYNTSTEAIYVRAPSRPATFDGECVALVNNLDTSSYISAGRKVYVAVVIWKPQYPTTGAFRSGAFRYEIIYTDGNMLYTSGYLYIILPRVPGSKTDASIQVYKDKNWVPLSRASIPGSGVENMYASPIASLLDPSTMMIYVYNRTLLVFDSVSSYWFTPTGVGLGYNPDVAGNFIGAYFDNLVVTIDRPPWFVDVTGLQPGWKARIKVGNTIIAEDVADKRGVASIPLWLNGCRDLYNSQCLVYKDATFIVKNGIIEVLDSNGNVIVSYTPLDGYIIGGDAYRLIASLE